MNTETNNPSSGNELTKEVASLFESLKHVNHDGVEYWSARELYPHLGYAKWQRFEEAVDRAKESCKSASQRVEEHFTDAGKSFPMPKGGTNEMKDVLLTRYACYLVAQNGVRQWVYEETVGTRSSVLPNISKCVRTATAIQLDTIETPYQHFRPG